VAAAALALNGPGGVVCARIGNARLGVGIVAATAVVIVLIGLQRLPAMAPSPQLGEDRIMAAGALLRTEVTAGELIDVGRIRVQRLFADIAVAGEAHDLPVRRDVPAGLIHQPICVGRNAHAN